VCLIDNGIELDNDLNNIEEEGNQSEEIKEEELSKNHADVNINTRKNRSSNKLYKSQIEFNHNYIYLQNFGMQSMTTKNKKIYKPHVDQFGFIKKIKKEQQKLNEVPRTKPKLEIDNYQSLDESSRYKKSKNRFKEEEKRQEYEDNIEPKKVRINNFFQQNSTKKMSEETLSTNDNYPYSHKRSHRKPEELKSFLRLKKMQEREDKKSKEIENNKKLFIRFKNLYNLSMKDLFEDQYQKIDPTPRNKMAKSKSNFNINNSNKKKKEVNEYYIGTENSIRNNSTLVDQNEYFLHILESQQLLVNSKLKKIDNIEDTETNGENIEETDIENNELNNDINNSKEQINKITDKSKTSKTPSSLSSNNGLLNLTNFDNLKQKIDNTLKRVNQVFSKENWKKLKETSNTNSNNNNEEYGTVTGNGIYEMRTTIQLTATANEGYRFKGWSDGVMDASREITVTKDTSITANFVALYTIKALASASQGTVIGGGVYEDGETVTLVANPNPGYIFAQWVDGSDENPRNVTVNGNKTYTAYFIEGEQDKYMITWKNWDGRVIKTSEVSYGEVPVFNGEKPTRPDEAGYTFTFNGWSPTIAAASQNAEYTANYIQTATEAEKTTIENEGDISITTTDNTALFTWPENASADTYTLTITRNDEVFCSLTFDGQGRLINLNFPNLRASAEGYQFTVTGLNSGTDYAYDLKAKNGAATVNEYTGEFRTSGDATTAAPEAEESIVETARYDINGRPLNAPTKGVNIVKYSDGSFEKEFVK
jgi:hypothetical protein